MNGKKKMLTKKPSGNNYFFNNQEKKNRQSSVTYCLSGINYYSNIRGKKKSIYKTENT